MNNNYLLCWLLVITAGISGCAYNPKMSVDDIANFTDVESLYLAEKKYGLAINKRTLAMFKNDYQMCYDRDTMPYTSVVDAHNHFRPFGGNAISMPDMDNYLRTLGVLFVNVYGIGQTLPIDSGCEYYLDCPNVQVSPSIRNDFRNASNFLEYETTDLEKVLSMSFPDLAKPKKIIPQIKLLDEEYPNQFRWMGEVNLVKQALFKNKVTATSIDKISEWADFMLLLKDRNIPIAIHSDLGSNENKTQYLPLMEEVLSQYPDNKIVWVHMGLSKELTELAPEVHIAIMKEILDQYPHLMLDISWRVIWDYYFSEPESRKQYVDFFNQYSTRILPGTDFVASDKKDFYIYAQEVEINGRINQYLDNTAFRNIALGQNYLDLLGLTYETAKGQRMKYRAPKICEFNKNK